MSINHKFVNWQLGGNDMISTQEIIDALLDKANDEIPALDAMLYREAAERLAMYRQERADRAAGERELLAALKAVQDDDTIKGRTATMSAVDAAIANAEAIKSVPSLSPTPARRASPQESLPESNNQSETP